MKKPSEVVEWLLSAVLRKHKISKIFKSTFILCKSDILTGN